MISNNDEKEVKYEQLNIKFIKIVKENKNLQNLSSNFSINIEFRIVYFFVIYKNNPK